MERGGVSKAVYAADTVTLWGSTTSIRCGISDTAPCSLIPDIHVAVHIILHSPLTHSMRREATPAPVHYTFGDICGTPTLSPDAMRPLGRLTTAVQ